MSSVIDKYMPEYHTRDFHELRVEAEAEAAYDVLRSLDLERSWLVRAIFAIRALPARIMGVARPRQAYGTFLEQALDLGWVILEEVPGQELVAAAVTQPWAANVEFRGLPPEEFMRFAEPGFTKIVWALAARRATGGESILSMETRVLATDPASRRKFRRYWFVVSPGVISWVALRAARRELRRKGGA